LDVIQFEFEAYFYKILVMNWSNPTLYDRLTEFMTHGYFND